MADSHKYGPVANDCNIIALRKNILDKSQTKKKNKKKGSVKKGQRRTFKELPNGLAILRGTKSQSCKQYSYWSRGNQDIPNCLSAFVVHRLVPFERWTSRHIDMILDAGEGLYKDSYMNYTPKNRKLDFQNVLREMFVDDMRVSFDIYKPVVWDALSARNVEAALKNCFQHESFCILSACNEYMGVFSTTNKEYYYMFDPHERDSVGEECKTGTNGSACVIQFSTLDKLAEKFTFNMMNINLKKSILCFTITSVTLNNITKVP